MRNRAAVLQSGQALVLGVGLLTLGVLAWLLMLQVGGWVHNKSSLHRATDAAAYSAALVYARTLNLHAYLNRTQLAHQVAQLHLFSLASAERFRSKLARQATTRNPPASLLGYRFGMQYAGAYVFARQGGQSDARMRNALHKAFEQHEQLIHASLHHIRQSRMNVSVEISRSLENTLVMNLGKSGSDNRGESLAALRVRYRILRDDTEKFIVSRPTTEHDWFDMLQSVRTRYWYLDDRRIVARSFNGLNFRCPWMQHQLRRRGSLRITREGIWESEETQSFHNLRFNRHIGCYYREYPMGWAKLATHPNGSSGSGFPDESMQSFKDKPFWKWASERAWTGWNLFGGTRNPLAKRWAEQAPVVWRARQQAQYSRLNPKVASEAAVISLEVDQRWRNFPQLRSAAAAETYFLSPTTTRRSLARPSLFQPFWLARLVPIPSAGPLGSKTLAEAK